MNAALRIYPAQRSTGRRQAEILNAVFIRRRKKGRKPFFSEEKKQKTLQIQIRVPPVKSATASEKSLLLLFFRKEDLSSFLTAADEHCVQDFGWVHQDKVLRRKNPERGVHLSSGSATDAAHEQGGRQRGRTKMA